MEFFKIAQVAEMFMPPTEWRMAMIYGAAGFLIVFVFQAIALYTVATKSGYKHRWMAFIPFLSTYYIGVCAQKNKSLGMSSKLAGIIAASLELLLCAGYIMHYVGYHFAEPYINFELNEYGTQVSSLYNITQEELTPENIKKIMPLFLLQAEPITSIPVRLAWAGFCFQTLDIILSWVQLAYLFLQVMLVSAFFQTYAARRYLIFTICSVIFPIQGILFFVVRNNRGMSYRDYVRGEQERQYRMYRQYYGQNGYNTPPQNDGYGGYSRPNTKNDDPFGEFGNSNDDDPFNN